MKKIIIYTSPNCKFCHKAKELFAARGLGFEEIDVSKSKENLSAAGEAARKAGRLMFPIIKIGEVYLSGYSKTKIEEALK